MLFRSPHYVQERNYLKDDNNIDYERDSGDDDENEQSYGGDEVD